MKKYQIGLWAALVLVLASCETGYYHSRYKANVLKYDSDTKPENLWYICDQGDLIGVDKDTHSVKVRFNTNSTTARCNVWTYENGKYYIACDGAKDPFMSGGSGVYVLDNDFTLIADIQAAKGIGHFTKIGKYLVADSSYYTYDFTSLMTIINPQDDSTYKIINNLPGIVCNVGKNWTYNDKIYVGTTADYVFGAKGAVVVYDQDFNQLEVITSFNNEFVEDYAETQVFINGNHLLMSYVWYPIIKCYDLDTREQVGRIDLRDYIEYIKDVPGGFSQEEDVHVFLLSFMCESDDKIYYLLADGSFGRPREKNYIIIIDKATSSFDKAVEFQTGSNLFYDKFFYNPAESEYIYYTNDELLHRVCIEDGKVSQVLDMSK